MTPEQLHLRALCDAQADFDEAGLSRAYLTEQADVVAEYIQALLKPRDLETTEHEGWSFTRRRVGIPVVVEAPRTLGQQLKEARGKKSQEQVAAAFQRTSSWISGFETGKTSPDKDTLEKLLDYYRVQARQVAVQIQAEHVRAAALVLCDRSRPIR